MVSLNVALQRATAELVRVLGSVEFQQALAERAPLYRHKGKRRRTRWWVR